MKGKISSNKTAQARKAIGEGSSSGQSDKAMKQARVQGRTSR